MKKYFTKFFILFNFVFILPLVALAADPLVLPSGPTSSQPPPQNLGEFFNIITGLIGNSVIPLIFTLAFMFFVWGVVQYVLYPDDEGKKEKGRQFMIWGLIALTVMFSVWGLVNILTGTFGIDTSIVPHLPETPN